MKPARFAGAAEGMARERAMLAAARRSVLIWQAGANALVVPAYWARRDAVMAAGDRLAAAGWPVLARSSGGGAVPQGPATLNLAIIVPLGAGARIENGFELICTIMAEALARFGIETRTGAVDGAFCDGRWNLNVAGKKLAGTAQRWCPAPGRRAALVHAALQLAPPPASVWSALATLHRAAGQPGIPREGAHTSLACLVPQTMRLVGISGALAEAAQAHAMAPREGRCVCL